MKLLSILTVLNNRTFEQVVIAIIFTLLGILVDNSIIHLINGNTKFYDFRLYEVVQTSVTVVLAVFISYIVSNKVNTNVKRREVVVKILDIYQERMNDIYKSGSKYFANPSKELEKQILSDVKLVGGTLSILKSTEDIDNDIYKKLFESYLKFKIALTNHPFASDYPIYDTQHYEILDTRYGQHLNDIQKTKLSVFTLKS